MEHSVSRGRSRARWTARWEDTTWIEPTIQGGMEQTIGNKNTLQQFTLTSEKNVTAVLSVAQRKQGFHKASLADDNSTSFW